MLSGRPMRRDCGAFSLSENSTWSAPSSTRSLSKVELPRDDEQQGRYSTRRSQQICFNAAQRTTQVDTAETLKALAKTFSAKATVDAYRRLFEPDRLESAGGGAYPVSRTTRTA